MSESLKQLQNSIDPLNQLSNDLDVLEARLVKILDQRIANSRSLLQFAKAHVNDQIRHNVLFKNSNSKDLQENIDRLKVSIAKAKGINAEIIKTNKTLQKKEDTNMAIEQIEEEKTYQNYVDGGSNMPSPYRAQILDKAKECVSGQRVQDYGTPEDNFGDIASAWNWYLRDHLKTDLLPRDVALMMTLMKVARAKNGGGSGDSFVDIAGYAACCAEIDHNAKEA